MGIRHIGQENAKILANYFVKSKKFLELLTLSKRKKILINLKSLDGMGDTQIKSINTFFSNKKNIDGSDLITGLHEEVEKFLSLGSVLLMGDLNSRTNSEKDFMERKPVLTK